MGQGQSNEQVFLETRVENPPDGQVPRGLALIAHGRLGGDFNQPVVRLLAEYFCQKRRLRVVSWNARGTGKSGGVIEWKDFGGWIGDAGVSDYKRMLQEAMSDFVHDLPQVENAELFICGYSAGSVFAGCTRPPPILFPQFSPAHYILVSYPVDMNPFMGLHKSGSYFRSVEALVQGHGWENLPSEFGGQEPEVAGVLTVTGRLEKFLFYNVWTGILAGKNSRNLLKQVVVKGAGHAWGDKASCVVDEIDIWLRDLK